ncbi:MAG: sigma-54-dependent Fis family transcriptional regulator [Acidobacteria bacterium]|nr:MAG: sigma-54-dependent Fis family transcriptional regulator [Acidobacteriota bacterium]
MSVLKVLIFDDQANVVEALRLLFEVHGIPVTVASSADDLIERLSCEEIGVVVQDMNFSPNETSGEEGTALFRRIRQVDSQVTVLLITAWASLATAVQLVKEGATDYLSKPWDDDKLVTMVGNLMRMQALQIENHRLQDQRRGDRQALAERHNLCGLVYESEAMHKVVTLALNVADSDAPVMITGPSGCGKEKVAEIIQANSPRSEGPFVRVNLGALPEQLMESELFGAEPGAYTGLKGRTIGRFEAADRGTLFMDEIDSLSLAGQVKLLRVVQSGEYQRLGSSTTRTAHTRLISATNADLKQKIADGSFREDLFYRLNVVELRVPPLNKRPDDIPLLAHHFLKRFAGRKQTPCLTEDALTALVAHPWPGNIRELENRMQRAILVHRGRHVDRDALDLDPGAGNAEGKGTLPSTSLAVDPGRDTAYRTQRERIEAALLSAGGVISQAAGELGLSRQALYRKMSRLGIVMERKPRI